MVSQTQFLSAGLHGDGRWIVPITISLGSYERRKNFLMETKSSEVDLSDLVDSSDNDLKNKEKCDEQLWVKVNIEQSGFYRVKYEDKLAARLRKAIEHNSLEATDKFGMYHLLILTRDDILICCYFMYTVFIHIIIEQWFLMV